MVGRSCYALLALAGACATPSPADRAHYLAGITEDPSRCLAIEDALLAADCQSYAVRLVPEPEQTAWCDRIPTALWREACFFERARGVGLSACPDAGSLASACTAALTRAALRRRVADATPGQETALRDQIERDLVEAGQPPEVARADAPITLAHAIAYRAGEGPFDTADCGTATEDECASAYWISLYPGLMIVFAVVCFNLMGDGLRDALDPRLRGS